MWRATQSIRQRVTLSRSCAARCHIEPVHRTAGFDVDLGNTALLGREPHSPAGRARVNAPLVTQVSQAPDRRRTGAVTYVWLGQRAHSLVHIVTSMTIRPGRDPGPGITSARAAPGVPGGYRVRDGLRRRRSRARWLSVVFALNTASRAWSARDPRPGSRPICPVHDHQIELMAPPSTGIIAPVM